MTCFGQNAASGKTVEVRCGECIDSVTETDTQTEFQIAPAWIDLQVNGYAGVDFNDPEAPQPEIARAIRVMFSTGVSCFYPTVITGSPDAMGRALRNLARAAESLPEGAAIGGLHVEGPHISPEDGPRGAHPREWVRAPDLEGFAALQGAAGGRIRMVTLSPEWDEAPRFIEAITARGVVAAIGHTNASPAQIANAVAAGATLSTHLGNGSHAVLPRHPNYIWEQLAEDRLMAGFIADGIHLDAAFLKAAIRAKGVERAVLVTDASAPAGGSPGRYSLGEQDVELTAAGRVVLAGTDRLAGSALRMDRAVENAMRLGGAGLADAVRMATTNAARAGAVAGRMRGLAPGDRADLVQFRLEPETKRIVIVSTWMAGRQVYRAD